MIPLLNNFNLDSSGVAGFFGGDEAIAAMLTVHLYQGRRWLGWYNSSGGYSVAKYYGKLARTRILRGMYPGVRVEPVELFGLGGKKNPGFIAAHSGTFLGETGHLGFLLMKYCRGLKEEKGCKGGRQTTPVGVTVVTLRSPKGLDSTQPLPAAMYDKSVLFASVIPIGASLAACIACGVGRDWYALSMILLGMMANGIACCRIGSGVLMVNRIKPADNAGRGDGVLTSKNEVVIVRGPESAIAQVTRGSFFAFFWAECTGL
ncbi:hypothetical protein D9758_006796 [Tetrapyrgos nigripes]|uniref:Uncharacterized protein n=1 Tax=Tetrapyrgos nigripes TaxID=182062 RepID=A0A8H5CY36_9AGAR|nr:hypothetical protein D9758_006796 [Tetrapyrgos nigripes]